MRDLRTNEIQPHQTWATSARSWVVLGTEAEADARLSQRPPRAAVVISASDCYACRMMHPALLRLAASYESPTLLIDGDREKSWMRRHGLDGYPSLLLFRDGALARVEAGYENYRKLRAVYEAVYGGSSEALAREEDRFAETFAEAERQLKLALEPASRALEPLIDLVNEQLAGHWKSLTDDLESGGLSPAEAYERQSDLRLRLYAPLKAEIEDLRTAQKNGLAAYEKRLDALSSAGERLFAANDVIVHKTLACDGGICASS